MTSTARVVRDRHGPGHMVHVWYGGTLEVLGPFRWRWVAELVRWLETDAH